MTANADRFNLIGHNLDNKFRVERMVAEGGFGVVYYATHLMLDRPIALKVLKTPPGFNEEAKKAFIDGFTMEAKTIVRISHPNIVQVLDFGVWSMPNGEHAPWMALEWLNGQTLREVLMARRGQGGQNVVDCYHLMKPALEALAYAHEEGIAHRDIKPANMMLVPGRRNIPVLKLLDFGIAKVMQDGEVAGSGETRTASSLNAFSMAYAAPEQIGGGRTGPWTDVHAMASIMSEILTDQPPYDGKERTEICCDALSPVRPTPAKRGVDVGPWEPILAKAVALKPNDRFPNISDFLAALESVLPAHALVRPGTGTGTYTALNASHPGVTGPNAAMPMPTSPLLVPPSVGGMGAEPTPTTMRGAATSKEISGAGSGGKTKLLAVLGGVTLLAVVGVTGVFVMNNRNHTATANPPVLTQPNGNNLNVPVVNGGNTGTPTGQTNQIAGQTNPTNPTNQPNTQPTGQPTGQTPTDPTQTANQQNPTGVTEPTQNGTNPEPSTMTFAPEDHQPNTNPTTPNPDPHATTPNPQPVDPRPVRPRPGRPRPGRPQPNPSQTIIPD